MWVETKHFSLNIPADLYHLAHGVQVKYGGSLYSLIKVVYYKFCLMLVGSLCTGKLHTDMYITTCVKYICYCHSNIKTCKTERWQGFMATPALLPLPFYCHKDLVTMCNLKVLAQDV